MPPQLRRRNSGERRRVPENIPNVPGIFWTFDAYKSLHGQLLPVFHAAAAQPDLVSPRVSEQLKNHYDRHGVSTVLYFEVVSSVPFHLIAATNHCLLYTSDAADE